MVMMSVIAIYGTGVRHYHLQYWCTSLPFIVLVYFITIYSTGVRHYHLQYWCPSLPFTVLVSVITIYSTGVRHYHLQYWCPLPFTVLVSVITIYSTGVRHYHLLYWCPSLPTRAHKSRIKLFMSASLSGHVFHLKIIAWILLKCGIVFIILEAITTMHFQLSRVDNNSMAKAGTCEVCGEQILLHHTRVDGIKVEVCMKHQCNNTDAEEEKYEDKSLYNIAMFTSTLFKRAKIKSNPAVLDNRPVTNCLSYGMLLLVKTACSLVRRPKRFGGSCCRHHFQDLP